MADANNNPRIDEGFDDELGAAAEELIIGDSDDPPLSETDVVEMLRIYVCTVRVHCDHSHTRERALRPLIPVGAWF